jgi:branched-chain amino acid transport system permease protein
MALVFFAVLTPLAYTLQLGVVTTLTTVLLVMLVAHGWNLLGGYGGYLNFGMATFSGTGVYTAAMLNAHLGWSMWQTLVPAALMAAVVAVPVGLATLRLRGHYFAIFTLVLTFLAQVIVFNSSWLGGALGVYTTVDTSGGPRALAASFYYTLLLLVVLATVVAYLVEHSNFGYALRAIKEDEDGAAVLGVRTFTVKMRALLIGAAMAGLGGGVYAYLTGYIEPNGSFDLSFSLDIVLVCVIGGLGTWQGPLIGATIVVLLEQWLRTTIPDLDRFGLHIPPEANRVVLGVLLIVFALFARRGVVGIVRRRRGRIGTV